MKKLHEQLTDAIANEVEWRKLLESTDRGSYCEDASFECKITAPVQKAYANLVDVLLMYQRSGIKQP